MTGYVEYVRATGAQYIRSGFIPNGNTTVEIDWEPESITLNQALCCTRGAVSSGDSGAFAIFYLVQEGYGYYRFDHYGASKQINPSDMSARQTITTTKTSITVGDATATVPQSSSTSPLQMFLMASNSNSSGTSFGNYMRGRLYRFRIWDNGTLVRDFRPYEQNGVYGLMDDVNGTFYDSDSGTPLMGPLKKIEYIQGSDGGEPGSGVGQYIDTGVKPSGQNTKIIADVQALGTYPEAVFGSRNSGGASASQNYTLFAIDSSGFRFDYMGSTRTINTDMSNRHTIEVGPGYFDIDGTRSTFSKVNRTNSYPLYLTSVNSSGVYDRRAHIRIYGCKIYDGDTLIHDYIPYKSGETPGLWDSIEREFKSSQSTLEYVAGPVLAKVTWTSEGSVVRVDEDVIEGSSLKPPDITKPGFRTDWYLDGVLVDFNSFVMPSYDVEFEASYYPLIVTLYLYDTGGLSIVEKNVGDLYTLPEGKGSRGEFVGWMFNGELVTAITVPESSTTLFARYKESGTIIQIGFVSIQPNPSYVGETLLASASVSTISTDVPLWTDLKITAESGLPMSSPYQAQIWDTSQPGPLAVFEGDGIKTTGRDVPPIEAQDTPLPRIGIWSDSISDSEGLCDFVIHGSGSKSYTSSVVVYSSEEVQIREAEITYHNGSVSETQTVTSSTDRIQFPSGTYTSFDIRILRVSKPYSHVRILSVVPGGA